MAAGTITAQEGAARLDSLEAASEGAAPAATGVLPETATRRVTVISQLGSTEIIGDPDVKFAVADGPHRARQEGDTMVIEHLPFEESGSFAFGKGDRRIRLGGFEAQHRKLRVRMNPELPLKATVQAGNVRVEGLHGPIASEVQAGNCKVEDFRGPLDLVVMAGNISASGRLVAGASKVRCEMGSVKIDLERGSSVRITAHTTLGKVAIEGAGGELLGQSGRDVTIGAGAGTLDVDCTMGNVRLRAE